MSRAMVQLAVAGLVLSALGFQFTNINTPLPVSPVRPRITQAIDDHQRVVLKGNTHPSAQPKFDRGAAPGDLAFNRMLLVLKRSPEQEQALRQLLDEQQDKASPNYHRWLTPDEFGKQFGPADQDIDIIRAWLHQHGFQVGNVARGRSVMEFSGTAAQVQEAFATSIHKYVVKGKQHWANANDPEIPAALAPVVGGVFTMHDFRKKPMLRVSQQRMSAQYVHGQGYTTFPGNPPLHALSPADYATIYNIASQYQQGINGTGQTIAIVGRSDLFNGNADIGNFNAVFGTSAHVAVLYNGPNPGDLGGGEEAEATLDTTWSAALAPGASVDLVVSASTASTDGVDLSELYIIDNNVGDVMSESFGTCELAITQAQADGISALAEQAAAQGITYTVASGDSGAEGCDDPNSESIAQFPPSVNVLAATPFTVAVGGTAFNEGGQANKFWNASNNPVNLSSALSYIPEDAWNESCTAAQCGANANIWAGGGGASIYFSPKPSWQAGVTGIPNDNARDLPDVSLMAAGHDPYLLCVEGSCVPNAQNLISFWAVSGTSASAPSFAAIMALVNQKMGSRQGQANYVLYKLAAQNPSTCNASTTSSLPTSNCIFNDTTVGNNAVPGETGYGTSGARFPSGRGYDLATGLGSVNVGNLLSKWSSAVPPHSTTTALVVNPQVFTHGASVSVQITVSSSSGTPSGDVSLLMDNSPGLSGASFNLCSSGCTLSGGSLSAATRILRGGSYYVHAHYAGDSNFAASDSPSVLLNVLPEGSNTVLGVTGAFDQNESAPYGTLVQLQASVVGQSGYGIPTGSINFVEADSSQVAGDPYLLNNFGTTATLHGLFTFEPGTHTLTANYSGDSSFNASSSAPATPFGITLAPTASQGSVAGAPQGATLSISVTSASGGAAPSGTVNFSVDGVQVGSAALQGTSAVIDSSNLVQAGASGQATLLDSTLINGQHAMLAAYSGDSRYASTSSSVPFNLQPDFTVTPATPSQIAIRSAGGTGTLMFSIAALDGFAGTVSFSCSGLPAESACNFSPGAVKGSGTTLMTVTTTAPKSAALHRLAFPPTWASAGLGIAGLFLLGVPARQRRCRKLLPIMLLLLTVGGCGGGGGNNSPGPSLQHDPGTLAGTYNATVLASSGSLLHRIPFQLIIQ